jgi:hypothetical protein
VTTTTASTQFGFDFDFDFDFEKDDDECPMEDDVVARQKCKVLAEHRARGTTPCEIHPSGEMTRRLSTPYRIEKYGPTRRFRFSFSLGNADGTMDGRDDRRRMEGGIWTPAAKM